MEKFPTLREQWAKQREDITSRKSSNSGRSGHRQIFANNADPVIQCQLAGAAIPSICELLLPKTKAKSMIEQFDRGYLAMLLKYCVEADLVELALIQDVIDSCSESLEKVIRHFLGHIRNELDTHSQSVIDQVTALLASIDKDAARRFDAELQDMNNRLWSYRVGIEVVSPDEEGQPRYFYGENSEYYALRVTKDNWPNLTELDLDKITPNNHAAFIKLVKCLSGLAMKKTGIDLLDERLEGYEGAAFFIEALQNHEPLRLHLLEVSGNDDMNEDIAEYADYIATSLRTWAGIEVNEQQKADLALFLEDFYGQHEYLYQSAYFRRIEDQKDTGWQENDTPTGLERLAELLNGHQLFAETNKDIRSGINHSFSSARDFGEFELVAFGSDTEYRLFEFEAEAIQQTELYEAEATGLNPNEEGIQRLKDKATAEIMLCALSLLSQQ